MRTNSKYVTYSTNLLAIVQLKFLLYSKSELGLGLSIMALSKPTEKNARHLDVQAGQYWLATANGLQSWPVVICDEDMVQTFFKSDWRPRSARQPDGMWKPGYRDGGMLAACRQFPVLFLGLTKLYVC